MKKEKTGKIMRIKNNNAKRLFGKRTRRRKK